MTQGAQKPRLGELLVGAGLLAQSDLDAVLREKDPRQKIGRALVERGLVSEQQLTQALSQLLSVPWVSLYHIEFSRQLLDRVPRELAERFGLVPIFVRNVRGQGETLYVATDDPTNEAALAEVSRVSGLPTRPMIASTSDIQAIVQVHYAPSTQRTVPEPSQAVTRPEGLKKASSTPAAPPEPKVRPEKKKAQTTKRKGPEMSLTLLDGTKIILPAGAPKDDGVTARDIVAALRARSHGADASEILGPDPRWEAYFSALLGLLLRKGLLTDREIVEELSKI